MKYRKHKFSTGTFKVFTKEPTADGLCFSPDDPYDRDAREIWIKPSLRGRARLEAVIHEGTHADQPRMTEEQVTAFAHNIMDLVWREGYRRTGEKRSGRNK